MTDTTSSQTPRRSPSAFKPLQDYGIIGDLRTIALIGRDGSADWLCYPYLDSPSVLAALLDPEAGGAFAVRPYGVYDSVQDYLPDTNVLRTTFVTATGRAELTDFMPVETDDRIPRGLYRRLTVTQGTVHCEATFAPRFDYARQPTRLTMSGRGVHASGAGQQLHLLSTAPAMQLSEGEGYVRWLQRAGKSVWFVLSEDPELPAEQHAADALERTRAYWERWERDEQLSPLLGESPWRDVARRSGLVLKLLEWDPSGGLAAAPTTSLPEEIGGMRNWDYRYSWIRDASFTVQALFNLGYHDDARRHLNWFREVARQTPDPAELRIMYSLDRRPAPPEQLLGHLRGYRDSRPVRIGNGAVDQQQFDIYGELVDAFYQTTRYEHHFDPDDWALVQSITDHVCRIWDQPDAGIWEVRGEYQHFTYSKLMCWVAVDRALRIAGKYDLDAPTERWRATRKAIREAILERGFNPQLGSFVQYFGGTELDATSLFIPLVEFLPAEDPRVQGTIDATMRHLAQGSLVHRYKNYQVDGLPGEEGAFVLCSFWLIRALAVSGRVQEAEDMLAEVLSYASPLGLLSEEIDVHTGELLGNYPQAYSHVGLINSVLYIEQARRGGAGPEPVGTAERTRRHLDTEQAQDADVP